MYKYVTVIKYSESEDHLDVDSIEHSSRSYAKLDINDIPNSSFSKHFYGFDRKDWEKIKETGKMTRTIVQVTTIEVEYVEDKQ
jgi:hypothetical protein